MLHITLSIIDRKLPQDSRMHLAPPPHVLWKKMTEIMIIWPTWKCLQYYLPFVQGIHWLLVDFQCKGSVMQSFDGIFVGNLYKYLKKPSIGWWNNMPFRSCHFPLMKVERVDCFMDTHSTCNWMLCFFVVEGKLYKVEKLGSISILCFAWELAKFC